MRLRIALVLALGLAACDPPKQPAIALFMPVSSTAIETREIQLHDDLITVRLHIPPTPERRKATVISTLGDRASLLTQGFLVVTYRINWEVLKGSAPPQPPHRQPLSCARPARDARNRQP